jgi:hypothetical protein
MSLSFVVVGLAFVVATSWRAGLGVQFRILKIPAMAKAVAGILLG